MDLIWMPKPWKNDSFLTLGTWDFASKAID